MQETITAKGHKNVVGTHESTIEVTKEKELSTRGHCIIGVCASKSCADLSEVMKAKLKQNKKFKLTLKAGTLEEIIIGYGNPALILTNPKDIVIRKSSYIDDRTLLIKADKACKDLSREFIEVLKSSDHELILILEVNSESL